MKDGWDQILSAISQ